MSFRPKHRVGQKQLSTIEGPSSLEHGGVGVVALLPQQGGDGPKFPKTTRHGVEQCAEDDFAVVIRQAKPIDCAVRGDKSSRAPVANYGL